VLVKHVGNNENAALDGLAIPNRTSRIRPRHTIRQWVAPAGFVIAYLVLEWVSFIHEYKGLPVTPWNPGLGVALALMILRGPRYGLALFAGIIIAEVIILRSTLDWSLILAIAAIISSGYALAAVVCRQHLRLDVGLTRLRDVLVVLAAGIAGAALVTFLLTLILLATGKLDVGDIVLASFAFLVGDIIGIAVTTPLLLRIGKRWREQTLRLLLLPIPEAASLGVVFIVAFWAITITETVDGFKLFYLLFLPVVVAAVRHGLDGACLSLAATQLGLVGLLHRHGYEAKSFTEFQVLMFVLTVTGLIVGIVVSERREADRAARKSEARLKEKEAEVAHAARFSLVNGMTSALAHEINQPMAAARALARSAQELLRAPQADLSRAATNLSTLIAEIDLASGIVRRMREFLRRSRPRISTIDVQLMLDDILALIRPEASSSRIVIDVDAANDLPLIHGDRVQLQQVILNLVRNAVDSLAGSDRSDGRVRVAARRSPDSTHLEFSVSDNGSGIPAEFADRLFQPFTTSKKEGLGLGLAICLAIVEAHGGRIWLQSKKPGATEFCFSLPLELPKRA
jgi:two-component system, LuxR family, sensor kinase FixL